LKVERDIPFPWREFKMQQLFRHCMITQKGWFQLLFHSQGIYRLFLPGEEGEKAVLPYPAGFFPWPELEEDLVHYFNGGEIIREYPLDLSAYTWFQQRVLQVVRRIGYGEVLSYGEVADRAGFPGAGRAVGNVLAANRFPLLIPCHRVIRTDGSMGGFSAGESWKESLLGMERKIS